MPHISTLIEKDIQAYLKSHETKSLLRFITCGSVDDGKSTLIGRLLYDSKMIFEDQMRALEADSSRFGTQGERIDFALLVDGLAAEREQGITIDVAYRFFSTDQRKFIVADTPGHEQYTRNMVTGASTSDLAVVLIDARKGVLTQTKRHTTLVNLVGIKEIVLAVNKMDLVSYKREVFDKIVEDYKGFAAQLGIAKFTAIPMSALEGDNITSRSINTGWYTGPTLMGYLETVAIDLDAAQKLPMRFPVQWVNRPNLDFRGFTGTVAAGTLNVGDAVRVMPSGKETKIKEIVFYKDKLSTAFASQAVTLTLEDEVDVSRGDVLCDPKAPPTVADQFEAKLVWMVDEPMYPGRSFWLKCGAKTANATVTKIKYKLNVNTLEKLAAEKLTLNSVASCNISTDTILVFDVYTKSKAIGGFILIDRLTNNTVAAGMINFALRRAKNVVPQAFTINKEARAAAKNQTPKVFWFTGLSGSGKSTIANVFEQKLHAMGKHTYILDGDNVRHGLNRDLGFTETDRVENIRRVAEVAKLMIDAGLIVLVTFISPFRADRARARSLFNKGEFIEVFVDTPLEVAEQRDPKGLYAKARQGDIKNFTGIDSPYEAPKSAEVVLSTEAFTIEKSIEKLVAFFKKR
jgi:bifunctional enzyme CysN/CysC